MTPVVLRRKAILRRRENGETWAAMGRDLGVHPTMIRRFIDSEEASKTAKPRANSHATAKTAEVELANRALEAGVVPYSMPAVAQLIHEMLAAGVDRVVIDLETNTFELRSTTRHALPEIGGGS